MSCQARIILYCSDNSVEPDQLAGSLGRCLNTRPIGLLFKQLTGDPANVNA